MHLGVVLINISEPEALAKRVHASLTSSSDRGIAHSVDETAHLVRVFLARATLDAAGDIDGKRANYANGIADIVRRQTARQYHGYAEPKVGELTPRRRNARAAKHAGDMGIDEDGFRNNAILSQGL